MFHPHPAWQPPPRSTVLFVHGAVVNGWEMIFLRRRLRRLGYHVPLFHYHSMTVGLRENVARLRDRIRRTPGDILHVVGHSMGGVLARHAFETDPDPRPGRLIAIGSPFLDCWVAHRLHPLLLGQTVHDHIRAPRDPVWRGARELGVLAGTYPFGLGRAFRDFPSPNDGIILLAETRLQGLADHAACGFNHFGMLLSRRCTARLARFLATGKFAVAD
jgi:pimeloyl-ACP methyl ester carboxylesterase